MAETSGEVTQGQVVTWEPVRELAHTITKLYTDKCIVNGTKTTRSSDPDACKYVTSSTESGFVNLAEDTTAPFRVPNLGKPVTDEKVLAFEFAYDPDKYEEYLYGNLLPVLTTQYLIRKEVLTASAPGAVAYTTGDVARELGDNALTINNLIESDRSKLRQFWNYGKFYTEGQDTGGQGSSSVIAGELYMLLDDPSGKSSDCCYIARVAFAGKNSNGNGNSEGENGKPAPWVDDVGDTVSFVTGSPWNSSAEYAVTLTGVSMDRDYTSDSEASTNTEKGFRPETPSSTAYTPPPVGCSGQFIWPTIGTHGGGKNSFYSPNILSSKIDWADWRPQYTEPLTPEQLEYAKIVTTSVSPDDEHFPCYLGEGRPGSESSSYEYLPVEKSITTAYQRWVKVSDTVFVRMVPMEFNVNDARKAYLAVPITIAKILKPKSYQTAIRKRWYDMLYYSLRNIAGYKYKKMSGDGVAPSHRVIGVTWDRDKLNDLSYMNPCTNIQEDCACDRCSYERWKILDLGGEGHAEDDKVTPFVGSEADFASYNGKHRNAAQMWTWESERYNATNVGTGLLDMLNYDTLFPELYFERLLCYKNSEKYSAENGGFINEEQTDTACGCIRCKSTTFPSSPIILPWEGGGNNTTCSVSEGEGESNWNTHAYTFNVLSELATFIDKYKAPEDKARDSSKLEIGYCYCPATAADKDSGLSLKLTALSYYSCDYTYYEYSNETHTKAACTYVDEERLINLPEIPSYYNTLSKNEKAAMSGKGTSCMIDISKDLKPFGYNAYVWKAVDVGGYKSDKEITIEFTHYNPARVCSSGTIVDKNFLEESADSDPLYMYNTNCYKQKTSELQRSTRTDSPCSVRDRNQTCPNAEGTIKAFNHNRQASSTWKEALYWCSVLSSAEDCGGGFYGKMPYTTEAAETKLWHRNNELTAIGTIEIYVAPFYVANDKTHRNYAKLIGSCNLKRTLDSNNTDTVVYCSGGTDEYSLTMPYYCSACGPVSAVMDATPQEVVVNEDAAYTTNAADLINFSVEQQPTDIPGDPSSAVKVKIVIPSNLLLEEDLQNAASVDLRQKYIILAMRASHTNINSCLASSDGVIDADAKTDAAKWATTYAGACRYAEFRTAYKFSVN